MQLSRPNSVACLGVKVSVTFHLTCVHYFSLVWVGEWPPFGKKLLTRLAICSLLYFDYFLILFISRLGLGRGGWIWVLIASVPDLCILLTFLMTMLICQTKYKS